ACPTDTQNQLIENSGRILIGVRGDTSLTDVDVAMSGSYHNPATSPRPAFHCILNDPNPTPALAECDQKVQDATTNLNLLTEDTSSNAKVNPPDEPYALALDPTGRAALYVGHLVGNTSTQDSGGVSLFDASGVGGTEPDFPVAPSFVAPFGSPFPANSSGL